MARTYTLGEDLAEDAMTLILANEPSKDSAENVEVFLTVISALRAEDDGLELGGFFTFVNLNFASSLDGHDGIPQSTVPAGFQRKVYFLATGLGPAIVSQHAGPRLGGSELTRFERFHAHLRHTLPEKERFGGCTKPRPSTESFLT
jgi:hypothetical protein